MAETDDPERLRHELIQVAAMALAWLGVELEDYREVAG